MNASLDSVFTPLIAQVHRYRSSVIKFGGDALIVWFGSLKRGRRTAVLHRTLTAAHHMQKVMRQHGQIATPIGPVTLRMKIGLTYGPVKRPNLGQPPFGFEDVLAGHTLDRMADNEHHAEPGDIMVDTATLLHTLQARQTQVAELKPVVSLFVQFHGLDYDTDPAIAAKLHTYFGTAQQVVARHDGRLNRLITGDKGSLLHIIFGAPRSVEEQEERAVRCALDLQAECGELPFIAMQRIGITSGRVFAGPVGSPRRHDYTTMGDAINLSARLMQHAADNQILLDTAVFTQLSADRPQSQTV